MNGPGSNKTELGGSSQTGAAVSFVQHRDLSTFGDEDALAPSKAPTTRSRDCATDEERQAVVKVVTNAAEGHHFFADLLSTDEGDRSAFIEKIICEAEDGGRPETFVKLGQHMQTIVRLAQTAPFKDVRDAMITLLSLVEKKAGFCARQAANPSFFEQKFPFISGGGVYSGSSSNDQQAEDLHILLQDLFTHGGRVSHLDNLLAIFPEVLESKILTEEVMINEAPLPPDWQLYIGIMAASRHNCVYLVRLLETQFILQGGQRDWLLDLDQAPMKLRNLSKYNAILAHQPWRLTVRHIEELVKGDDCWSLSELMSATCVLTTFHALAGLVLGVGVQQETDLVGTTITGDTISEASADTGSQSMPANEESSKETDQLRSLLEGSAAELLDEENCNKAEEFEKARRAEELPDAQQPSSQPCFMAMDADCERFSGNLHMAHEDFLMSSKEYSVFYLQQFDWKTHGAALLERYLPGLSKLMDANFETVYSLTQNTLNGQQDIDTLPFRRAVWYYLLSIKGLRHDDYNYREVNVFLNIDIKKYIKKVACTPESISRADYMKIGYSFQPHEKLHINMLASEARKQAEMLHALQAINQYMLI